MTIYYNPATEKYPAKLNVSPERLTVADTIAVTEMIVSLSPDSLDMTMILNASCVGIESRDKGFKAENSKCNLSFKREKKQQYSVEQKKYEEVAVSKDENYLFVILSDFFVKNPAVGYTGQILPWINPFFWELIDQNTAASSAMAGTMKDKIFSLSFSNNKGAYTKAESEAEKLQARVAFLKAQTSCLFDWQTLGELALIIRADPDSDIGLSTKLAIELAVKLMGNK
ncbi:MAG: hypothetical protein JGK12_32570 [Microcoleus sp. PH2017_01_SCD_O_A]|uniref:hypothetical protein n=1 Tax=Microcoleus sp. PH2017_01_SCD_O_A TaxID=2798812 RepID=UPI001D74536A|nr:hypothetical protein [Microcoleus sp. PH2017_01_SCD_O_A]MCC3428510.1 hypothetical protein [Microcoleus sp. PH2017_01_SCD_O_A]